MTLPTFIMGTLGPRSFKRRRGEQLTAKCRLPWGVVTINTLLSQRGEVIMHQSVRGCDCENEHLARVCNSPTAEYLREGRVLD